MFKGAICGRLLLVRRSQMNIYGRKGQGQGRWLAPPPDPPSHVQAIRLCSQASRQDPGQRHESSALPWLQPKIITVPGNY